MACEAWLRRVDGTGGLARYASTLQQRFPRLEDVVARYVRRRNGGWELDPQFFTDLGVEDEGHRRLFAEWFARGPEGDGELSGAAEGPADPAVGEAHCRRWLREVDPSGGCERYAPAVMQRFSHFGELAQRYVKHTFPRGGNGPSHELEPAFFEDVGVSEPEHQQLFSEWFARGPPDPRGQRSPPGIIALFDLGLEEWLHACDCNTGRLGRYRLMLQQNFDSVEQIMALYLSGGELDAEFFSDLGIDDRSDRELFQASIRNAISQDAGSRGSTAAASPPPLLPAAAFRGWSFAAWLREVSGDTRSLRRYVDCLEEQYDTVEQIVEIYSCTGEGGRCGLSGLFFNDIGVEDAQDRALFEEWFARCCLPPSASQEEPSEPSRGKLKAQRQRAAPVGGESGGPCAGGGGSAPTAAAAAGTLEEGPSRRPRPEPDRFAALGSDFDSWLRMVGIPPGGPAFARYLRACQANPRIRTVAQLVDKYLLSDPGGGGYVLDCQLFQEMEMQSAEHRQLVEDWLLGGWRDAALGQTSAPGSPCRGAALGGGPVGSDHEEAEVWAEEMWGEAEATPPPDSSPGPSDGFFARWLWDVGGGITACPAYEAALEEMYDTPEQVVRLYTASPSSAEWDPHFFEDAGIRQEHRPLFARWLAAQRGHGAMTESVPAQLVRPEAPPLTAPRAAGVFEAVD